MAVSRICMFPVKNMPAAVCPGTPAGACCIWIIWQGMKEMANGTARADSRKKQDGFIPDT